MNYQSNSTKRFSLKIISPRASAFNAILVLSLAYSVTVLVSSCGNLYSENKKTTAPGKDVVKDSSAKDTLNSKVPAILDTALFDQKLIKITNGDSSDRWPVKAAYPNAGAILPFKRIVAYYGNFYSKQMGVLGEYPPKEMLARLQGEIKKWQAADTSMAVQPAIHYIAVTAQGSP